MNLRIQESLRWQACGYLPKVQCKHLLLWGVKGLLIQLLLCYFFYQSWISVVLLLPITLGLMYEQWAEWTKKIRLDIEQGFKDWLYYIKSGLGAGRSVEQAMYACRDDFMVQIGQKHAMRCGLEQFYRCLELHIPVEECIRRFGEETEIEVIRDFAVIFQIAQRKGGRVSEVLERSIRQICDRIELRQEIKAMIAAKQLEQRIMCTMPFAILFFVGKASGGYFNTLYHNVQGVCIMTGCLAVYVLGVWWGQKLTKIDL